MAQPQVIEGTWEDILANSASRLTGKTVRIYIESEDIDGAESLSAAVARLESRTAAEAAVIRGRLLAQTPPPRDIPEGKTIFDMVMGTWPGAETDEQVNAALERLS